MLLMTRKKIFWALMFTDEKFMSKIRIEIKDHEHHICLYSCPVLQCLTMAYYVCCIALIW